VRNKNAIAIRLKKKKDKRVGGGSRQKRGGIDNLKGKELSGEQ